MRKMYIECSTAYASSLNTGIQRVVRNVVAESAGVGESLGMDCIPVVYQQGEFRIIPQNVLQTTHSESKKAGGGCVTTLLRKFDALLGNLIPEKYYYQARSRLKGYIKKNFGSGAGVPITGQAGQGKPNSTAAAEDFPILVLLDSTWDSNMWGAVDAFRATGGFVVAVLYDLIPFTHPETVAKATRVTHTSWWSEAPEHLDGVMCISKAVRDDFLAWQSQNSQNILGSLPADRVDYFYLGSELSRDDPHIRLLTEGVPFYLVVGSIEPRKNHAAVLDAFEVLWDNGRDVRLAIVGAYGWKSEEILQRIENHPRLNENLFFIRDATDRDLVALYEMTQGLVFASYTEGFGLPIVEAYQRGAEVICSDIPVFREIAGDDARYFNPLDFRSLVAVLEEDLAVTAKADNKKAGKAVKPWISWKQSTEELLRKVRLLAEKK